ncbi:MAG: PEP/pyruvate-binding domain-containing protein [Anaerolineaceae bacterium]
MDWIIPIAKAAADFEAAGSKGANLGMLVEAGLPVPPGFVLTTAAYDAFIRRNELQAKLAAAAAAVHPDRPASAEQSSAQIAAYLRTAAFPGELVAAIREAYDGLGGVPVAARSSIVTQDDITLPFYGQGETILNVLGAEMLLDAIRACWISLWSAPAQLLRAGRGIPPGAASMAVVVQRMFRTEVSGVIMTVNVQTRNPDEMVIRAARRAQASPQEIIFNRYSRSITRQSTPGQLVILPDQAVELARLGERIESHFGCHQEIEWAWDEDTFCILQSCPIAVQIAPRIRWHPPQAGSTYSRLGMLELLPDPVSTLFESIGLPAFVHGRLEYAAHLGENEHAAVESLETINGYVYRQENPRGGLVNFLPRPWARHATENAIDLWEKEVRPQYRQEVQNLSEDAQPLPARELVNRITGLAQAGGRYWAVVFEMMPHLEQAEERFRTQYARLAREGFPPVTAFLGGLETLPLQAERAFAAACAAEPEEFPTECGSLLYSLDFSRPLAGEDRSAWRIARQAIDQGKPGAQPRFMQRYHARIQSEEQMRASLSGWQRRMFAPALNAAQRAIQAREDALYELGLAWAPLRRYALELGRRLVAAQALHEPDQVFWLRRNELAVLAAGLDEGKQQMLSQSARVQARRMACEAVAGAAVPLRIPQREQPAGEEQSDAPAARVAEISGRGISPGKVMGKARVLRGSADFVRLQAGDVIIASAFPPAWTTLLILAGGVVLDLGGAHSLSSRAALLAGLPMVIETGNATRLIRDGEAIELDGDEGIVHIAAPSPDLPRL